MSEVKEVILPFGGMNSDDVYNAMPEGDYPNFAYGLRSAILGTGNNMSCENIKGTRKLNYTLPPGENKCIGWCKDYENNGYIYFIYNSNDIHKIVQYIPSSNTFNDYQSPLFNFSINHRIHHADKIGDLLYWTDGYNPPRKVNLKTMFSGGYGANFDEQVLDVIKYPYVKSPVCSYSSIGSYQRNMLRGKLFQFAIRYVYDDYEKSCWSPISKVPLPVSEETISGSWIEDQTLNNVIHIRFDTGHPMVKRIEIAAREGNTGDWFLIDRIDKYDDNNNIIIASNIFYLYCFYNNKQSEALDQTDNARLFDYVPQIAGTQAVIEKNMLAYGDITEGYDNVPIDIRLSARMIPTTVTEPLYYLHVQRAQYSQYQVYDGCVFNLSDLFVGDVWSVHIVNNDKTPIIDFTVVEIFSPSDASNPSLFFDRIVAGIEQHEYSPGMGYYNAKWSYLTGSTTEIMLQVFINLSSSQIAGVQVTTVYRARGNKKIKSWSSGWITFGLIYYDAANRSGAVNVSEGVGNSFNNSSLYIKDYAENYLQYPQYSNYTNNIFVNYIQWQIHHKPPIWATHYQWAYTRQDGWSRFMDMAITTIVKSASGATCEIDVNTIITNIATTNKKSVLSAYIWQKGDRIRFIKKLKAIDGTFSYIQKVLDYEINGQDATTGVIYIDSFDYAQYSIGPGTIVKIYSPRKGLQKKVFCEFGEVGEIGDAGLPTAYHKKIGASGSDQTSTHPANGRFDSGDIYVRARWTPSFVYACEAEEFSDWYDSKVTDIGRPNAIIQDMRRLRLQADIRRGGIFIEDSKINGMSTFKANDKIDLTAKYGIINKLVYRGFTLKVYQTYKVTPIYINRSSQADVTGKESLIFSDKVMTIGNTSNEEWGTDLPASVITYGNSIYFFDRHSAQWIWDAGNGLIPINNKMSKEFKLLSQKRNLDVVAWVNEYGEIISSFSYTISKNIIHHTVNEYGEIISSFSYTKDGELVNIRETKVLMFNTADKRWKTYLPFYDAEGNYPEMYAGTDENFVSWINGEIYLHNVGAYNEFFGVQHTQKIPILFNNGAKTDKIFQTIEVVSTDVFDCPNDGDIFIMDEDALPQGMKSRLKAGQFKWKEGKYVAGFMRDVTTPGNIQNKIINGRPLRGKVLCCILHNNSKNLVILKSVTIKGITSELNS